MSHGMLAYMPEDLSPLAVVALAIASLRPRSRVVALVATDVSWVARSKPFPAALEELERLRGEVAAAVETSPSRGVVVEVAGLARVSIGTSGRFTGVVVLVAAQGEASRVVLLPVE